MNANFQLNQWFNFNEESDAIAYPNIDGVASYLQHNIDPELPLLDIGELEQIIPIPYPQSFDSPLGPEFDIHKFQIPNESSNLHCQTISENLSYYHYSTTSSDPAAETEINEPIARQDDQKIKVTGKRKRLVKKTNLKITTTELAAQMDVAQTDDADVEFTKGKKGGASLDKASCSLCALSVKSGVGHLQSRMKNHVWLHMTSKGNPLFTCALCNAGSHVASRMRNHLSTVHGVAKDDQPGYFWKADTKVLQSQFDELYQLCFSEDSAPQNNSLPDLSN